MNIDPSQLYGYLLSQGATANEAAMLASAAHVESGGNPAASHDGGTGYGLFGHRLDRLSAMQEAAGSQTPNWQQQASFALSELRSRPESALVNSATTPQQLTTAQMYYERPQGFSPDAPQNGSNWDNRLAATTQLMGGKMPDGSGSSSGMDPSTRDAWTNIFKASGLTPSQMNGDGTPQTTTPGSAGSSSGSMTPQSMQQAMTALQKQQTPVLSRLLFGDGGFNGMLQKAIPTPYGGQGLLPGAIGQAFGAGAGAQPQATPQATPAPVAPQPNPQIALAPSALPTFAQPQTPPLATPTLGAGSPQASLSAPTSPLSGGAGALSGGASGGGSGLGGGGGLLGMGLNALSGGSVGGGMGLLGGLFGLL